MMPRPPRPCAGVLARARALDVAEVAAGDDHLLLVDQLLGEDLALGVDDLRAARVARNPP